jgi:hypothetical protein
MTFTKYINIFVQLLILSIVIFQCSCDNSTEPKTVHGCLDSQACNYNPSATIDNNSCEYLDNCDVCDNDPSNDCEQDCADVWGGSAIENECGCVGGNTNLELDFCYGCPDHDALNFNPEATIDDGSCDYPACETITDFDGIEYETVLIGSQCWMAENLKVIHYRNGDVIPAGYSDSEWSNLSTDAYAVYPWDNDDISQNTCEGDCVEVYGNMYNWYAVYDTRDICPEGWHTPSDEEWTEVADYLGGSVNESGLNALLGGHRDHNGYFGVMGTAGYFWSSTERSIDSENAYARVVYNYNGYSAVTRGNSDKRFGYSVRCLRD